MKEIQAPFHCSSSSGRSVSTQVSTLANGFWAELLGCFCLWFFTKVFCCWLDLRDRELPSTGSLPKYSHQSLPKLESRNLPKGSHAGNKDPPFLWPIMLQGLHDPIPGVPIQSVQPLHSAKCPAHQLFFIRKKNQRAYMCNMKCFHQKLGVVFVKRAADTS